MKKTVFIFVLLQTFVLFSQFSEGFFETLEPSEPNRYHFGGCALANGGILGVRFAYNETKEVQWVKMNTNGDYEFFAADLPQGIISNNENIIEVFEEDNFQYILTQISKPTENIKGYNIYKYENYTNLFSSNFFEKNLTNSMISVSFKYNKFYISYVETDGKLKVETVSTDLNLINSFQLTGGFLINNTNLLRKNEIFLKFNNENNIDIYSRIDTNIVRLKFINNQFQNLETFNFYTNFFFGFNKEETKLLVLENSFSSNKYKKYLLENLENYEEINISFMNINPSFSSSNDFHLLSFANKDCIINRNHQFYEFENNILIETTISKNFMFEINKLFEQDNKNCIIGSKKIYNPINIKQLIISKNDIKNLLDFKEYGGVYKFGNYFTRFGIGNNIFDDFNFLSNKDFIFHNKVFFSGQYFVGKSENFYKGENELYNNLSYKPGPYTPSNFYNIDIVDKFNENFFVTHNMLNEHVYAINNNISSYIMPKGIKNWPAHGDVSKGQVQNLAPFVDVNNNGIYEPDLGDFPSFPGTHCLLNITHQLETDFENTGSGLELHSYMYNFSCDDTIRDVIFLKTQIFNRSLISYDSLSCGLFNDFDLGNYNDDFIGTHVENGLIYTYNGDNFDEANSINNGFGDSLPTMACMFLKGNPFEANALDDQLGVSEFQTINGFGFNDGVIDNEHKGLEFSNYFISASSNSMRPPNTKESLFNYLNGKWYDGTNQVFGGIGYYNFGGSTNIECKYSFPGNSDPSHYGTNGIDPGFIWSEETVNNPAGDRRMIGSFGSSPLASGESITYHSAFLAGKRSVGVGQSEIDLFAKAAHVKKAFNSNLTSCGQSFDNLTSDQITSLPKTQKADFKIFPNPMENELNIVFTQENSEGKIMFYDINGKTCLEQNLEKTNNKISVNELKNGFYIVSIETNNGTKQYKLIKR
jgi:hypothetical protein